MPMSMPVKPGWVERIADRGIHFDVEMARTLVRERFSDSKVIARASSMLEAGIKTRVRGGRWYSRPVGGIDNLRWTIHPLYSLPECVKPALIADPGFMFYQMGYKLVEFTTLASMAQDVSAQTILADPEFDIHAEHARLLGSTRKEAQDALYCWLWGARKVTDEQRGVFAEHYPTIAAYMADLGPRECSRSLARAITVGTAIENLLAVDARIVCLIGHQITLEVKTGAPIAKFERVIRNTNPQYRVKIRGPFTHLP